VLTHDELYESLLSMPGLQVGREEMGEGGRDGRMDGGREGGRS
jgi:hypothetical protein